MKKYLLSLICVIICISMLVSCNYESTNDQSLTDGDSNTVEDKVTDGNNENDGDNDGENDSDKNGGQTTQTSTLLFDYSISHKIMACDGKNKSIVIFDMNTCSDGRWLGLTKKDAVVWEFKGDYGFTGMKYRYSPYFGKYVVAFSGNAGNSVCGIIDYDTKELLWSTEAGSGFNAHGIEMLPNGDVVLFGSSGKVCYYPISTPNGGTQCSQTMYLAGAHDGIYDSDKQTVWVAYDWGVRGYKVNDGRLEEAGDASFGTEFTDKGGHAIVPCYGESGKYWVSAWQQVFLFDTDAMTLTKSFDALEAKGIAYFSDETMVLTLARIGSYDYAWETNTLIVKTKNIVYGEERYVGKHIAFSDRMFYKIIEMNPNYK